jgi:hypothetical protein
MCATHSLDSVPPIYTDPGGHRLRRTRRSAGTARGRLHRHSAEAARVLGPGPNRGGPGRRRGARRALVDRVVGLDGQETIVKQVPTGQTQIDPAPDQAHQPVEDAVPGHTRDVVATTLGTHVLSPDLDSCHGAPHQPDIENWGILPQERPGRPGPSRRGQAVLLEIAPLYRRFVL